MENVHRNPEGGDRAGAQEDCRENSQGKGRRVPVLFVHRLGAGLAPVVGEIYENAWRQDDVNVEKCEA